MRWRAEKAILPHGLQEGPRRGLAAGLLLRAGMGLSRRSKICAVALAVGLVCSASVQSHALLVFYGLVHAAINPPHVWNYLWSSRRESEALRTDRGVMAPTACHGALLKWFAATYAGAVPNVRVLDVGGSTGLLEVLLQRALPAADIAYECIDTAPRGHPCQWYEGDALRHANKSVDVVVFSYVLHHAAGNALGLLKEARRVARQYVVIAEDLKAVNLWEFYKEMRHDLHATFRHLEEWRQILRLLGMEVVHEDDPGFWCGGFGATVRRRLLVAKV